MRLGVALHHKSIRGVCPTLPCGADVTGLSIIIGIYYGKLFTEYTNKKKTENNETITIKTKNQTIDTSKNTQKVNHVV